MLSPIFPITIYKQSLGLDEVDRSSMRDFLNSIFDVMGDYTHHSLEKDGGKSSHSITRDLHQNSVFYPLVDKIYRHLRTYYKELQLSPYLEPVISSMWANSHMTNAWSDLHIHSVHHLVGCYYLDLPNNSGDLLFLNPLEYHYNAFPFSENGKTETTWHAAHAQQDELILFPSFLKHKTEKNNTTQQRISINFNIDFQLIPPQTFTV
jgi:uncharacterized protein (TIGR02466 family)